MHFLKRCKDVCAKQAAPFFSLLKIVFTFTGSTRSVIDHSLAYTVSACLEYGRDESVLIAVKSQSAEAFLSVYLECTATVMDPVMHQSLSQYIGSS